MPENKDKLGNVQAVHVVSGLHDLHQEVLRARDDLRKAEMRYNEAEARFQKGVMHIADLVAEAPADVLTRVQK